MSPRDRSYMEKFVESQAASVDLAVDKALVELNTSREKVEVEVLEKGGLFHKAKVRVTLKDNVADRLCEFLNTVLKHKAGAIQHPKILFQIQNKIRQ